MNGKNWWKHILMTAALAGCFVACAAAADLGVGTVNGEGLRLRQEPSLSGAVIVSAHKDERVMVLEQAGDWYKVDYATQVGYMSAAFVDVSTSVEADLGYGMVTTSGGALNLRSAPGTDSDKVDTLPCRTVVSLAGFQDGWYKVTYNDLTGYVSSEYITLVDAQGNRADGATDAPVVTASGLGQRIVDEAMKHVGKPYVYATHGPNSFDCSGFTHYCVKQASGGSIVLSTGSAQQWTSAPGQRIYSTDQLQPGDLFFIDDPAYGGNYKIVTHVAIYAGNGMLVHASSGSTGVIVNPIKDKDYRYFVGAIRLG